MIGGKLHVGDIVLYQRKDKIDKWEINEFSPSGKYIAIENDDYDEEWCWIGDILEVIESDYSEGVDLPSMEQIQAAAEQPIPRFKSTQDFVRPGPVEDRHKPHEI